MNLKKNNIAILVLVFVLSGGFYFSFNKLNKQKDLLKETLPSDGANASTTTVDLGNGVTATVSAGSSVQIKNSTSVPKPIPSLSREVIFAIAVDPAVKTTIQTKVTELQKSLLKDPKQFSAWIDMGIYHKVAGDYEGAKIYWDYAGKLAPTDFISFGNLGNMYAYQLKDMAKAEQYYNQAIKNGPTQIYLYFQLAEAFRDVSKDIPKAKAVVERGLVANPGNTELLALRDSLK